MLRKAARSDADAIVFDLEDAVASSKKSEARKAIIKVLSGDSFDPEPELLVRINPFPTGRDDVVAILDGEVPTVLDGLVLPKVEGDDEIEELVSATAEFGAELPVLALIETATGVLNAESIALSSATDALVFGAEDLAASLGATRTNDGTEVLYAREHVLLAARAVGIDAIDTVYPDISDLEGLETDTEFAVQLGYDGKLAIHPAQVAVIHEAIEPSGEQLEWARRVLDAGSQQEGVFEVDGQMIDAPLLTQAKRILGRTGEGNFE